MTPPLSLEHFDDIPAFIAHHTGRISTLPKLQALQLRTSLEALRNLYESRLIPGDDQMLIAQKLTESGILSRYIDLSDVALVPNMPEIYALLYIARSRDTIQRYIDQARSYSAKIFVSPLLDQAFHRLEISTQFTGGMILLRRYFDSDGTEYTLQTAQALLRDIEPSWGDRFAYNEGRTLRAQ